jgi:NADH-quinone oxidoreductase subunit C
LRPFPALSGHGSGQCGASPTGASLRLNWPGPVTGELQALFPKGILESRREPPFEIIRVDRRSLLEIAGFLKASKGFDMLMDLTAVDWLGCVLDRPQRFELVYYLMCSPPSLSSGLADNPRLRIKVLLDEGEPEADSLSGLFPSANWLEREVWDMYGIRFRGHPDLKRLLLYEEFVGHPLRKDYPLLRQQPRVPQLCQRVPPFGRDPFEGEPPDEELGAKGKPQ